MRQVNPFEKPSHPHARSCCCDQAEGCGAGRGWGGLNAGKTFPRGDCVHTRGWGAGGGGNRASKVLHVLGTLLTEISTAATLTKLCEMRTHIRDLQKGAPPPCRGLLVWFSRPRQAFVFSGLHLGNVCTFLSDDYLYVCTFNDTAGANVFAPSPCPISPPLRPLNKRTPSPAFPPFHVGKIYPLLLSYDIFAPTAN